MLHFVPGWRVRVALRQLLSRRTPPPMPSLFDDTRREALHRRIDRLSPESARQFGRMSVEQMVCHLIDAVESAFDDDTEPPGTGALSRQPLKWLILNALPWPKEKGKSPARLQQRKPTTLAADVAALHDAIERLAARDPRATWPSSEVFGSLTRDEWGALLHAHCNHHLKQFSV